MTFCFHHFIAKLIFFPLHQIPFPLVTRLWDTYLAEGDALPDFLVYIFASFLLTVRWKPCIYLLNIFYMFQSVFMFLWSSPFEPNRKKNMLEVLGKKTHFFSSWHKLCSFWKHFILKSLLIKVQTNIAFRFGFWITTL